MLRKIPDLGLPLRFYLPLILALAAGVFFRFVGLDHLPGINADEAYCGLETWQQWVDAPVILSTGSELCVGPLYQGIGYVTHAMGGINFVVLRLPSLLCGLLLVLLCYPMLRKHIGARSSLFVAALLATSPTLIGYSRISWAPSTTPLVILLCVWATLERRRLFVLPAAALAIWTHSANAFVLPMMISPWLLPLLGRIKRRLGVVGMTVIVALFLALAIAALPIASHFDLARAALRSSIPGSLVQGYQQRLTNPNHMLTFIGLLNEQLSGASLYRYVVGVLSPSSHLLYAFASWGVLVPLWIVGLRTLNGEQDQPLRAMAIAFLLGLPFAYLFWGSELLSPHTARHGLFVLVPVYFFSALFLERLAQRSNKMHRLALGLLTVLCLSQVLGFERNYFAPLMDQQHTSHRTFLTGTIEPKHAALERIEQLRKPGRQTLILAGSWWTYWPLRYLVENYQRYQVSILINRWDERYPQDFKLTPTTFPKDAEMFIVDYADQPRDLWLGRTFAKVGEISGYSGAPILHIYRADSQAIWQLYKQRVWEAAPQWEEPTTR